MWMWEDQHPEAMQDNSLATEAIKTSTMAMHGTLRHIAWVSVIAFDSYAITHVYNYNIILHIPYIQYTVTEFNDTPVAYSLKSLHFEGSQTSKNQDHPGPIGQHQRYPDEPRAAQCICRCSATQQGAIHGVSHGNTTFPVGLGSWLRVVWTSARRGAQSPLGKVATCFPKQTKNEYNVSPNV